MDVKTYPMTNDHLLIFEENFNVPKKIRIRDILNKQLMSLGNKHETRNKILTLYSALLYSYLRKCTDYNRPNCIFYNYLYNIFI